MGFKLTSKQTPEMLGLPPALIEEITKAGGTVSIPDASKYYRLGGVLFPKSRTIQLQWEIWPSKEVAVLREGKYSVMSWTICPEPNVVERELQNSEGKVVRAARILPTYDAFMATAITTPSMSVGEHQDALRKAAYALAASWPDFEGMTQE